MTARTRTAGGTRAAIGSAPPAERRPLRAGGDYRLGLALVTGSAIAWSLAGFFTRLIPLDTWTLLAWRGIFGAVGVAAVMLALDGRGAWATFGRLGWPGWCYALLSAGGMIVFIAALRLTTVAHVSVIYATVPFFAAALGWVMLREAPSRAAILASLAALVGVAIMVGISAEGRWPGDALAVCMTAAMAGMMVMVRRYPGVPAMAAAALSALLSGLVCWPFGHPLAVSGMDLLLLALFGLVNSAAGLALFTLGARRLPPIETALIGALDAPLAPLWVWLVFQELPGVSTVIGGLIVFAAVAVHTLRAALRSSPAAVDGP